jgi:hypothetical protein
MCTPLSWHEATACAPGPYDALRLAGLQKLKIALIIALIGAFPSGIIFARQGACVRFVEPALGWRFGVTP